MILIVPIQINGGNMIVVKDNTDGDVKHKYQQGDNNGDGKKQQDDGCIVGIEAGADRGDDKKVIHNGGKLSIFNYNSKQT